MANTKSIHDMRTAYTYVSQCHTQNDNMKHDTHKLSTHKVCYKLSHLIRVEMKAHRYESTTLSIQKLPYKRRRKVFIWGYHICRSHHIMMARCNISKPIWLICNNTLPRTKTFSKGQCQALHCPSLRLEVREVLMISIIRQLYDTLSRGRSS